MPKKYWKIIIPIVIFAIILAIMFSCTIWKGPWCPALFTLDVDSDHVLWGKIVTATGIDKGMVPFKIDWGDNNSETVYPTGGNWNAHHSYSKSSMGPNTITASMIGGSILATKQLYVLHHTMVILNPMPDVVGTTAISATGSLLDTDDNVLLDGKVIAFSGSGIGNATVASLQPATTQGILFNAGIGNTLNIVPCDFHYCTPKTGKSINILQMPPGSSITFPPGTNGVSLTVQCSCKERIDFEVTNNDGVSANYTGSSQYPDVATISPPADSSGIKQITILRVVLIPPFTTLPALAGISEIATSNVDANPIGVYDIGFDGVGSPSFSTLEVGNGTFVSTGIAIKGPSPYLLVNATFAGDSEFAPSSANATYSVIGPTFGIGIGSGSENSVTSYTGALYTTLSCGPGDQSTSRDGLCDSWKNNGIPYYVGTNTFNYPLPYSNPNHKDLYVQLDSMNKEWVWDTKQAIQNVITVFNNAPITNKDLTLGVMLHISNGTTNLADRTVLNVWNDTDNNQTNDFFDYRISSFGNSTEMPTVTGSSPTFTSGTSGNLDTLSLNSGTTLTVPALVSLNGDGGAGNIGNNANSNADGLIKISETVNFGSQVQLSNIAIQTQPNPTPPINWGSCASGSQVTALDPQAATSSLSHTIEIFIPFCTTFTNPLTGPQTFNIPSITVQFSATSGTTISSFSAPTNRNSPVVTDTLIQAKAQAYHFALLTDCIVSCATPNGNGGFNGGGPSGMADVYTINITPAGATHPIQYKAASDIVLGVGPDSHFLDNQNDQQITDIVAGTFMHELGHNLGLNHGGPQVNSTAWAPLQYVSGTNYPAGSVVIGSNGYTYVALGQTTAAPPNSPWHSPVTNIDSIINCKPNYASVMSYSRQMPTYLGTTSWSLDYSRGAFTGQSNPVYNQLNDRSLMEYEGNLISTNPNVTPYVIWGTPNNSPYYQVLQSETQGTSQTSAHSIDWYGDREPQSDNTAENNAYIEDFGFTQCNTAGNLGVVRDYNDWQSLFFNFTQTNSGNFFGITLNPVQQSELTFPILVHQQRQVLYGLNVDGNFTNSWGSYGSGNGQFVKPSGVAVNGTQLVYVIDAANNRTQVFDENGNYITQWGSTGDGNGQFARPAAVAVDRSGNVIVADTWNARIQLFNQTGDYMTQLGSFGSAHSQFNTPYSIAVNGSRFIYVADSGNYRIQVFSPDTLSFVNSWGSHGTGNGQFDYPNGVAVDKSGNVFVADTGNNRIEKFDGNGNYITQWGSSGSGNGQFNLPRAVAVDSSGNVFVDDSSNRIQVFSNNGNFIFSWGSSGSGNGQFNSPFGMAVDTSGSVFVADTGNARIQEFK